VSKGYLDTRRKNLCCRQHCHAVGPPFEQLVLQLYLQLGKCLGNGWLSDTNGLRGSCNAAKAADCSHRSQVSQVELPYIHKLQN
jgi:hypothetical protein